MGNYDFGLDLNSDNTMSIIISWIGDGARILEFGPANGRLTRFLKEQKGCEVTIVEIDEPAGAEAAVYAVKAYVGAAEGDINKFCWYDPSEKYDDIIFADVLEHLPNPQEVMIKCMDMLAPQGNILVSIPNIAHNSVLIDMYNDKFNYAKVGLLDNTHIHFFTYHTFHDMIEKTGMAIMEQKAIISRVGWNEIDNHYEDVPAAVERELRKRETGSVYQYTFRIGIPKEGQRGLDFSDLTQLQPDIKQEEAGCFVWESDGEPRHIGQLYPVQGNQEIIFDIGGQPSRVRIDFLEDSALIKLLEIRADCAGQEVLLPVGLSNANAVCGDIYLFENNDPWVEPELVNLPQNGLESIRVSFCVYDTGIDGQRAETYRQLIQGAGSGAVRVPAQEELVELKDYAAHLESDIDTQKEYVEHLERDISTQKEYVEHLERDINTQKEYIEHLEKDIAELKAYIEGKKK